MKGISSEGRTGILLSFGLALLFFLVRAIRLDLILAWDASETILPVRIFRDSSFLAGNPLREAVLTALSPIQWIISSATIFAGWDPFVVEYVRFFLLNLLASGVVWLLSYALFQNRAAAFLSVCAIVGGGLGYLGLGFDWKLGEWAEWHYFGLIGGLWVIYLLYRGSYSWASLASGFLFNIHPSHAVISSLFLGVTLLFLARPLSIRKIGRLAFFFGLGIAPAVLFLLPKLTILATAGGQNLDWWALMRARKSHHLFPLSWSWKIWGGVSLYVTAALAARAVVRRREGAAGIDVRDRERRTTILLATAAAICFLGFLFVEIFPLVLPTKLVLFRASNYLEILVSLYLAFFTVYLIGADRQMIRWAGWGLAFAMVWFDVIRHIAILFIPAVCFWTAADRKDASSLPQPPRLSFQRGWLFLFAATLLRVYLLALPPWIDIGWNMVSPSEVAPWKEVQLWAKRSTPRGAVFITPPDWCGFSGYSERESVMSVGDLGRSIYTSNTTAEEIRRVRSFSGAEPGSPLSREELGQLEGRFERMSRDELSRLASQYNATYAVVPKPTDLSFPRAYENSRFVVYRIEKGPSR